MSKDARVLTISIVECPAGGFVIKDGNMSDPDITAKSTLREAQNACADMIGMYFMPPPPEAVEDDDFDMPRMMQDRPAQRRGFFGKLINGGKA